MPNLKKKYETFSFESPTTTRDDYRFIELKPAVKTPYRIKQTKPRPNVVPLKDIHSMSPWRNPNVPFDLYHKPKPITQTDPRKIQERYDPPVDVDRATVRKTRHKTLKMGPANDMDALEEPYRQFIVDDTYCSTNARALKDTMARVNYRCVRAPLPGVFAKPKPIAKIAIEPVVAPCVPPEWRMDSVTWDSKQLRTHVEPTKTFWLSRKPDS